MKRIVSDETKRKMSESRKKRIISEETKKKLSITMSGHTVSEETRAKMSKAQKGHIVSEETRKKMSEAQKGKSKTALCKPIKAFIYKTGEFVGEYKSIKECSEILNIQLSNIAKSVSRNIRKHVGGYTFEYVNEKDKK